MPRIDPLSEEELGDLAPLLADIGAQLGFVPNSLRTLGRKPAIVRGLLGFVGAVMAPGSVSPDLKNMVAQIVSQAAGCGYCMAHTAHAASGTGIPANKEDAIWEFETSDLFTDAERAALRVAQSAGQAPNAVTDDDFSALKQHFTEEQIIEIIAVIGMFGFFNRFNDTMATELEKSPLRFATENLGPKGWAVGKHG